MADNKKPQTQNWSRRKFMGSAAALSAFTIVPRHVLGGEGHVAPSERLNLAGIGAGGNKSRYTLTELVDLGQNIVAVADPIDFDGWMTVAQEAYKTSYPNAKMYRDYREMLDKEPDLDGLIITTPDHWHAKITLDAMARGKHVYTEKPLTRTISECRMLLDASKRSSVATQMGNQGHAGEWIRRICEIVWAGVIGDVREVHAWSDRAGTFWQQGVARPSDTPKVPANMDWDLWLGPAPARPFHPIYTPITWRGWCDFGAGALGDMGCHILDPVYWALKLGHPDSIEATSTLEAEPTWGETYPTASTITYRFPARGDMPPVKITWYDGGLQPPLPEEFSADRKFIENGALFIGDKGKLYSPTFETPEVFPAALASAAEHAPRVLPRSPGHCAEWVGAAKGDGTKCEAGFDYSTGLTEFILLGTIAAQVNERLEWDGPNMKILNNPKADELVHHKYRSGWSL
jgi:predicted dehydrogenase